MISIAIVTGASSGIGAEVVRQLTNGWSLDEIWLIARRKDRLEELAQAMPITCKIFPCDLTNPTNIQTIQHALNKQAIRITLLVNAAGFGKNGDFREISREKQIEMINCNCSAIIELTHLCIPFMHTGSAILMISSSAGFIPLGAFAVYSASKAFLNSFSVALAQELRKNKITVTIATPGSVKTEFHTISQADTTRRKKVFSTKALPEEVVAQALSDCKKKCLFSCYGHTALLSRLLSRYVSKSWFSQFSYTKMYTE